ncbi:MAG: DUF4112 domain-containing protein [Rhizobiales bacterium]|nr:DUF4112 domain-containing protein [Hyphomicrobiales bacterium]
MRSGSSFGAEAVASSPASEHHATLRRLRWLADLFDDRFRLPGTGRRFGLDGILGLIPGIGDTATGAVSLYLAAEAWRIGMPLSTFLRMLGNVGIDMVLGAVPLLGDLFDFAWKANQKNVRLVPRPSRARHRARGAARRESAHAVSGSFRR